MDKHSYLEKIVETMALSPLPIALFQVQMRKFKTVALTTGLLDALNLDEKEARKIFDEDPYFLSLPEDKPALMRAIWCSSSQSAQLRTPFTRMCAPLSRAKSAP